MNSRAKGARGERQWRDELRANGYGARRGQQFAGGAESPDVVCDALSWIHFEVKAVERLNIEEAMDQARRDCGERSADSEIPKIPVVAHRRSYRPWLITMDAGTFFRFLRGDFVNRETREVRETQNVLTEDKGGNGEGKPKLFNHGAEVRPPIGSRGKSEAENPPPHVVGYFESRPTI
jgi:hypothetical protein